MIVHRTAERRLVCDCCGEVLNVKHEDWENPIAMRRLRRELEADHEICKAFLGNPERARAERLYREGIRRELGTA